MISTHIPPRLPKGGLWMMIISCIVLGHTSCSKENTPDIITPEPDTTVFAEIVYDGFTVKIREYLKNTPDATAALNLMKANLDTIMTVVPDIFLTVMRKHPIWMEKDVKPDGAAWYHVSEQWLIENHMDPKKVKCVEICNYVNYVNWTQQNQPYMVLHELCHLYHDQALSFDYPPIIVAYQNACSSGLYKNTERYDGYGRYSTTASAYALTDHKEYFAELSEAYWGRNDYFPYTRQELKTYDPTGFAALEQIWKVK